MVTVRMFNVMSQISDEDYDSYLKKHSADPQLLLQHRALLTPVHTSRACKNVENGVGFDPRAIHNASEMPLFSLLSSLPLRGSQEHRRVRCGSSGSEAVNATIITVSARASEIVFWLVCEFHFSYEIIATPSMSNLRTQVVDPLLQHGITPVICFTDVSRQSALLRWMHLSEKGTLSIVGKSKCSQIIL